MSLIEQAFPHGRPPMKGNGVTKIEDIRAVPPPLKPVSVKPEPPKSEPPKPEPAVIATLKVEPDKAEPPKAPTAIPEALLPVEAGAAMLGIFRSIEERLDKLEREPNDDDRLDSVRLEIARNKDIARAGSEHVFANCRSHVRAELEAFKAVVDQAVSVATIQLQAAIKEQRDAVAKVTNDLAALTALVLEGQAGPPVQLVKPVLPEAPVTAVPAPRREEDLRPDDYMTLAEYLDICGDTHKSVRASIAYSPTMPTGSLKLAMNTLGREIRRNRGGGIGGSYYSVRILRAFCSYCLAHPGMKRVDTAAFQSHLELLKATQ